MPPYKNASGISYVSPVASETNPGQSNSRWEDCGSDRIQLQGRWGLGVPRAHCQDDGTCETKSSSAQPLLFRFSAELLSARLLRNNCGSVYYSDWVFRSCQASP
jgi:hypothetical protein